MITPKRIEKLYKELIDSKKFQFPHKGSSVNAPTQKGVYIILNKNQKVVHVGCTPRGKYGIWQRLENHLQGLSSFADQYLDGNGRRLRNGYLYQFKIVSKPKDLKYLEALAIGKLCPKHIGKG